jgi:hypothetical protein
MSFWGRSAKKDFEKSLPTSSHAPDAMLGLFQMKQTRRLI